MAFNFMRKRKGEKATLGTSFWSHVSPGSAARIILRLFQFIMGLVTIGLYAQDLDNARKAGVYIDSKWVWAVVCGTLGALVSLAFMLPLIKAWFFFYVDVFVFLCYLIAFGIFGKMYIPEDAEGNKGIMRMKNAVWILLTNMLLWLMTACYGAVVFWKTRKARTTLTGRGAQHAVVLEINLEIGRWKLGKKDASTQSTAQPEEPVHAPSPAITKIPRISYLPTHQPSPTCVVKPPPPAPPSPSIRITSYTRLQPYPNQDQRSVSAPLPPPTHFSWEVWKPE